MVSKPAALGIAMIGSGLFALLMYSAIPIVMVLEYGIGVATGGLLFYISKRDITIIIQGSNLILI